MDLKGWTASRGVGYNTARRWYADGLLPVLARKVGGLILTGGPDRPTTASAGSTAAGRRPCRSR
ncbi:hypothetical protein [Frankia gtarii]|uniref:hypothetical protein n=1 Tax=Frankia gtarii TaxID=2950102 RepID=UPI0021BE57DA|nr:hypothetical protein [Frankia gtarii]